MASCSCMFFIQYGPLCWYGCSTVQGLLKNLHRISNLQICIHLLPCLDYCSGSPACKTYHCAHLPQGYRHFLEAQTSVDSGIHSGCSCWSIAVRWMHTDETTKRIKELRSGLLLTPPPTAHAATATKHASPSSPMKHGLSYACITWEGQWYSNMWWTMSWCSITGSNCGKGRSWYKGLKAHKRRKYEHYYASILFVHSSFRCGTVVR